MLLCALAASAQEDPSEQPASTIKVEVRQVLVPVVVTDRKGHHVTGLKARDFRVFEDGVEQKIISFGNELAGMHTSEPVEATANAEPILEPETAQPAGEGPLPIRRTYLVVLDSLFLSFDTSGRVFEALQNLFAQEQSSDSRYALVALGRELRIMRSVTRNPADILAVARNQAAPRDVLGSGAGNLSGQERQLRSMLEKYCRSCDCIIPPQPTGRPVISESLSLCASMLDDIERWTSSAALERSGSIQNFLRRFKDIVVQFGKQPGKRILILVSEGFDVWPGRDLYSMISVYTNQPTLLVRNPTSPLGHELEEVVRAATGANVVIYSVDSRGLAAPSFGLFNAEQPGGRFARRDAGVAISGMISQTSALEDARRDAMAKLSDVTGGVFYRGSNDLSKGLRQAFADEREFYVLAYVPIQRADNGKFRKIRVEVKDKKVRVRAKDGYWAPGLSHALLSHPVQ